MLEVKMPLISIFSRHSLSTNCSIIYWSIWRSLCRIIPLLSNCLQSHCGGRNVHLGVADKDINARDTEEYPEWSWRVLLEVVSCRHQMQRQRIWELGVQRDGKDRSSVPTENQGSLNGYLEHELVADTAKGFIPSKSTCSVFLLHCWPLLGGWSLFSISYIGVVASWTSHAPQIFQISSHPHYPAPSMWDS